MGNSITKVDIITAPHKLDELVDALNNIGIGGLTVSEVSGCGVQKGHKEYYRGNEIELKLLPKVKVEIVICEVPLDLLLKTVKDVLYTGNMGDGKIFVYEVSNVIRISNGDEGAAALKYPEK